MYYNTIVSLNTFENETTNVYRSKITQREREK